MKRVRANRPQTGARLIGILISSFVVSSAALAQAKLETFTETLPKSVVKVPMIPIQGGTLTTGGKQVAVKPFYMSKTEIPWEVYDLFLASGPPSPSYDQTKFGPDAIARPSKSYILPDLGWGHNGFPVINVSYTSVEMFCRWLSSVTKKKYRVPTEAEWEFAARGGMEGDWKIDIDTLDKSAWYSGNSREVTHPVGKKAPNAYGIHDLLGNVGEWALDSTGKPVLCGGTFLDEITAINPFTRKRWSPKWQETDPQIPKSRWWLADGPFVGVRLVCEP